MTDFTIPNTFIPGTKAKAQEVNENFIACRDAINSKAGKNGDSAEVMNVATATEGSHAVNKELFDDLSVTLTQKAVQNGTNFCAKSGNLNAQGEADLFTYAGDLITPKIGDGSESAAYKPCVVVNSSGTETVLTDGSSIPATQTKYSKMTPSMTSNTVPAGYTVSASSTHSSSAAFYAFDNSTSSQWASAASSFPASVQITLPSAKIAKYAKLTTTSHVPASLYIYGSNDTGTTKTVLYTGSAFSASASYDIKLSNDASFSTYGVVITSNANGTEAHVADLSLFEEDSSSGSVYFDETQNIYAKTDGTLYCSAGTVYRQKIRPTLLINDIWLDTSKEPVTAYKYNGTEDEIFEDVPLGQVSMSSGSITGVTTYSYNQNNYNVNIQSDIVKYSQAYSANGYTKMPNGIILQWGRVAISSGNVTSNITLPIAFPNSMLSAVVADTATNLNATSVVYNISATSLSIAYSGWGSTYPANYRYWIAIGF